MRAVHNIHLLRSRRRSKRSSGETVFEPLTAKHVIVAVEPQPVIKAPRVREKEKKRHRRREKRKKEKKTRSTTCLGGTSARKKGVGERSIGELQWSRWASLSGEFVNFITSIIYVSAHTCACACTALVCEIDIWQRATDRRASNHREIIAPRVITDMLFGHTGVDLLLSVSRRDRGSVCQAPQSEETTKESRDLSSPAAKLSLYASPTRHRAAY